MKGDESWEGVLRAGEIEGLRAVLGDTDIYLLDQLMKGRFSPGDRVLDAGCGGGRNLELFLRCGGFQLTAVDESWRAVRQTRSLADELDRPGAAGWVSRQRLDALAFGDGSFDVVVCSAVLHFARDRHHWGAMVEELWRVLAPGGLFFARLGSTIGVETEIEPLEAGRYRLPDGAEWVLTDHAELVEWSERLGGRPIEPIKTTVVDRRRAMTTWCLVKAGEAPVSAETG